MIQLQLVWRRQVLGTYPSRDMLLCAMAQDAARNGETIRTIEAKTFEAWPDTEVFFLSVSKSGDDSIGTMTYSAYQVSNGKRV